MSSPTDDRPSRWRPSRVAVTVVVVAMIGMWGYVLYLAFGPGRQPPPDRLDDPAFAEAAQLRCDAALDEVAALPAATESETPGDRADVVERANVVFAAMLEDLEELTPRGEDGELVREWLADWHTYLGDREAYATAVRDDPEAQLLVSAKDRDQITEHLDAFAADNHMTACATPLDV